MLNYYSWWVGGCWVGGSEKNEINAILNSKLKLELVEVGVELGNIFSSGHKIYRSEVVTQHSPCQDGLTVFPRSQITKSYSAFPRSQDSIPQVTR